MPRLPQTFLIPVRTRLAGTIARSRERRIVSVSQCLCSASQTSKNDNLSRERLSADEFKVEPPIDGIAGDPSLKAMVGRVAKRASIYSRRWIPQKHPREGVMGANID